MVDIQSGRPGRHVADIVALVFKIGREPVVILNLLLMAWAVLVAVKKLKVVNMQISVQVKLVMTNGPSGVCVFKHAERVRRYEHEIVKTLHLLRNVLSLQLKPNFVTKDSVLVCPSQCCELY